MISAFGQHFVKTGVFPKEFGGYISRLFRERQVSDYDFDMLISEDDALRDADISEIIVKTVEEYLMNLNLL